MPIKATESQKPYSSLHEEINDGSDIENKESDFKNVPTYPFQALIPDSFVFPGFKVRDKLSEFELLVIGFTDETDTISEDHQIAYPRQIYQKVYCNVQKKTDFELFGGESGQFYYHYFSNLLDSWNDRRKYADELYFVCKYWNKEAAKFLYYINSIIEVEGI